jgi:hypothetical protein
MSEHVYVIPAPPTCHTHLSSLHEGLLLPQDMCCRTVKCDSFQRVKRDGQVVVTAVFDISLAGDVLEGRVRTARSCYDVIIAGSEFKLVGVAGTSVDDVYLGHLMTLGRGLVSGGVGLVACQKCIHPTLKDYLHQEVSGCGPGWVRLVGGA